MEQCEDIEVLPGQGFHALEDQRAVGYRTQIFLMVAASLFEGMFDLQRLRGSQGRWQNGVEACKHFFSA
jgi:hypothetical protein